MFCRRNTISTFRTRSVGDSNLRSPCRAIGEEAPTDAAEGIEPGIELSFCFPDNLLQANPQLISSSRVTASCR
jgi:hypothetical protein